MFCHDRCLFNGFFLCCQQGGILLPPLPMTVEISPSMTAFSAKSGQVHYTPTANFRDLKNIVAVLTGLEPAASGVTGRRYNQLNYSTLNSGVAPSSP